MLTEFTGFARVLNGCLRVNPNAQTELVETLDAALSMSSEERSARAAKDLLHIQKCTIEAFAQRFVTELKATANKSADDFMCVGFGLAKVRLVGMGAEFKPLDTSEAVGTFQRCYEAMLCYQCQAKAGGGEMQMQRSKKPTTKAKATKDRGANPSALGGATRSRSRSASTSLTRSRVASVAISSRMCCRALIWLACSASISAHTSCSVCSCAFSRASCSL